MHMNRLSLLSCLFILMTATACLGQSYGTAAGLRLGKYIGLTVNQRVLPRLSVEGMYQTTLDGDQQYFTGLVKRHHGIISRRLNVYYGGGAHIGRVSTTFDDTRLTNTFTGVDAVLGVELTLFRFNVSVDYKPAINVGQDNWFENQGAVSVRYVLFETDRKKMRQREQARKKKQRRRDRARKYRERSLKREKKGKGW